MSALATENRTPPDQPSTTSHHSEGILPLEIHFLNILRLELLTISIFSMHRISRSKYPFDSSVRDYRGDIVWNICPGPGRYNVKQPHCNILRSSKQSCVFKSKTKRTEYKSPVYTDLWWGSNGEVDFLLLTKLSTERYFQNKIQRFAVSVTINIHFWTSNFKKKLKLFSRWQLYEEFFAETDVQISVNRELCYSFMINTIYI